MKLCVQDFSNLPIDTGMKITVSSSSFGRTEAWIDILEIHVKSRAIAEMAFLIGQGASIDFLTTGNKVRGQRALKNLLKIIK